MAKAKSKTVVTALVIPARPSPPMPNIHITLDLHPTAQTHGVAALQASSQIAITDKPSHESARLQAKGWKAEKKEIEAWYRDKMVTPLKKAYDWAREQMNADLAPFESAIAKEEGLDTAYVRAQEALERAEAERVRREAEAAEQAKRDREAAEAEAAALRMEESAPDLSAREVAFVMLFVAEADWTPGAWVRAAKLAGYKDANGQALKLMKSAKIQASIEAKKQALAIREAAEQAARKPIIVETPVVESQIGKVGGTSMRTYWSCRTFDTKAVLTMLAEQYGVNDEITVLVDKHIANQSKRLPDDPFAPLQALMSDRARSLMQNFERVYPFAKVTRRDGVAG